MLTVLGVACGALIVRAIAPNRDLPKDDIVWITLYSALIGYIGTRILGVAANWDLFLADPITTVLRRGDLVWYGGPIFGIPAFLYFAKQKKIDILLATDVVAPALAIGHGIGRIGCFLAGCCHGRITDSWIGVRFNSSLVEESLQNAPLYPTQLFEAASEFVLGGVLLYLFFTKRFYRRLLLVYVTCYAAIRFTIEFYRGDDRGDTFFGLSMSQTIALMVFIGALITLAISRVYTSKTK
jgi:phosphatidylglycerol:prolipoprotein diacylglycerol transferase